MKNIPIGKTLVEYGYVTDQQVQTALDYQKSHTQLRLGGALIELGYITEKQMLEALASRMELKMADLPTYKVEMEAVGKLPKHIAQKYVLIAVGTEGGKLQVVMNDPLNFYAIEDVKQITQMHVEVLLDVTKNIENAIEYYYSEIDAKDAAKKANISADALIVEAADLTEDEGEGDEAPVVQVLNSLLVRGYSVNASDIHIEPFEKHVSVRLRVDGILTEYVTLARTLHSSLIARIKILANLDIAERRLPQDGHFKVTVSGIEMNARVSVIPTVYGEKVVIRFLSTNTLIDNSKFFGMSEQNFVKFRRILESPYGIIYITGPTGSGKTTTLYMVLESLANRTVNISTIEDPVERNIARVNQVQVNNMAGLTFEAGLRSLLRQDPDIIMVGETRDNETASISVRSAITGHLVLSTLHTNDALSSVVRLTDMGVPPYLVANSVVGLIAQRLMRKVCPNCAYEYEPTDAEKALLGKDIPILKKGKGCHMCHNTGYRGRIAVHEVVLIDKELRRMISSQTPVDDMLQYVRETQGFKSLRDCALELLEQGVSTTEEFGKIAYYAD